jgi:hypothetical protein
MFPPMRAVDIQQLVASEQMDSLESARAQERIFKRWKNPIRVVAWFNRSNPMLRIDR